MRKLVGWCVAGMLVANVAMAGDVPVEVSKLGGSQIKLHIYPFLNAQDLKTLRLVATNKQALAIFVPSNDKKLYAAMALAPDDGFLKDGAPAETAIAISNFADAAAAAKQTAATCDAKRNKKGKPCVIVLEVGPAK